MSDVFPGRYTADPDTETVTVFLIGMRANRWWKLPRVLRVAATMPKCLAHLARNPEAGMLGYHQWLGRTTILVSYWRSPEHIQAFAADRDAPHLGPWREYMKLFSGSGDVGIYHETYQVPVRDAESVYGDMPLFGLARATAHVKIGAGRNTARQRLGRVKKTPATGGEGERPSVAG
ncbi:DUF4188 domain-containing protein [Microbacterium gorillae]|uniref:DUF4188 domain-containing protein n=1 Tax=Microbacterium gorillae TaxID=1231063 RepID=UPI0006932A06|nr:DUF4188 domain-containing protein [Microbacterium gorillae]